LVTTLRVLILEDNPNDYELVLHQLRRAGFEPQATRVETEAEFSARLDPGLDLIIADYSLPQFDGLRALKIVRARELDVPFILVSGTIGEEIAIGALQAGAADYVIKDRIARLGPAVTRALEEKRFRDEKKRAEAQIAYQANLIEQVNDAIIAVDRQFNIVTWNRGAEKMYGWTATEAIGRRVTEIVRTQSTDAQVAESVRQVQKQGYGHIEAMHYRKDGSTFDVEVNTITLRDAQGQITDYVTVTRDITESKRAEQEIARRAEEFAALYDTARDLATQHDLNSLLSIIIDQAAKLLN